MASTKSHSFIVEELLGELSMNLAEGGLSYHNLRRGGKNKTRHNRGIGKAKRKGVRELNSLWCSINYEKSKGQKVEMQSEGKKGRKIQGDLSQSK